MENIFLWILELDLEEINFGTYTYIETKDIREVLVLYSFRYRYLKVSHAEGFHITNICKAMGHSQEVQLKNYSKFIPGGTSEMYNKAN